MINFLIVIQKVEQAVSTQRERYMLVYMLCVLVILSTLIILFFMVFQKRKNKLLIDKIKQQHAFEEELSTAQTEIQEQTLKNIGMELHDNVGQLLSVAKMQINIGIEGLEPSQKEPFEDARETVGKSLSEIRSLSKVINGEVMAQWRLYDAIEEEVKRLNKSGIISVTYSVLGEVFPMLQKEKIIIFRIIQECCSNVVKHAQATELELTANYTDNYLKISIRDNGVGFDITKASQGSGLINMQSRAKLIDAELVFKSAPNQGTTITLIYSPDNDSMQRNSG